MAPRKFHEPLRRSFPEDSKQRRPGGLRRIASRRRRRTETRRPTTRTLQDVVSSAVSILHGSGLKYAVTGGVVIPVYGRVKATTDVDVIAEYDQEKLKLLVAELNRGNFRVLWEWVEQAVEERSHFTVFDALSPYHLDVKVLQPGEELGRTVEMKLYGKPTIVSAPEELVIHKLRFGSETDIEDARSIIIRQRQTLDVKYMLKKAAELSIRDMLVELLREESVEFE